MIALAFVETAVDRLVIWLVCFEIVLAATEISKECAAIRADAEVDSEFILDKLMLTLVAWFPPPKEMICESVPRRLGFPEILLSA